MCVRARRYTEAAIFASAIAIEGGKEGRSMRGRERGGEEKKGKIVFKIAGCPSNMEPGRTEKREIIGRRFRAYRGAHPEIYIGTRSAGAN